MKMTLESILRSPHRRSNPQSGFSSPAYSKKASRGSEFESWPTLLNRHRYLLVALLILTFLCSIYLYFAITLGGSDSCSEFSGAQKTSCQLERAKALMAKGKLRVF